MTPQQAVDKLGERLTTGRMRTVKKLFDAVAATADERATRRCAARVEEYLTEQNYYCGFTLASYAARDLLVSGGLKPT